MDKEKEIISYFLSQLPESRLRAHKFFESDAEIVQFGTEKLLFTTDEFSGEDLFRDDKPFLLGWNLAVCTISDILASGGFPMYFAHSVTVSSSWEKDFMVEFARGIASVLEKADASFIGGDLGISAQWKYTGICLGSSKKPLTRKGAKPGDRIYITGEVGAGNLEAAMSLYRSNPNLKDIMNGVTTRFALRLEESKLIQGFGACCIDTSDGVLNALNTLTAINGVGYQVYNLPYLEEGIQACKMLSQPKTFLFMGECGEYELLFTVSKKNEVKLTEQARKKKLHITRIGEIIVENEKILMEDGKELNFNDFDISARSFAQVSDYLSELVKYITYAQRSR